MYYIPSDSLPPIYMVSCLSQKVFVHPNNFQQSLVKTTKTQLDSLLIHHNLPSLIYLSISINSISNQMKGHYGVQSSSVTCKIMRDFLQLYMLTTGPDLITWT